MLNKNKGFTNLYLSLKSLNNLVEAYPFDLLAITFCSFFVKTLSDYINPIWQNDDFQHILINTLCR